MASVDQQPATNERLLRLLKEVQSELKESKKCEEEIARDLARLLEQRP